MLPLVSIVIPCYNSKDILTNCLSSVIKTKYSNFEIVIIDDHSNDGTYDLLKKEYIKNPKFKIARNKVNSGPSRTRNHGIQLSKGRYIAFVETDMEVDPNWLTPLVKALEADPSLGCVYGKTLDINKRNRIHSIGVKYNPHTFWVISPGCGAKKNWLPDDLEMGIGAVGSLVRKSVIKQIGGFDEKLVHNVDDLDLGWRIWLTGYGIHAIPESITYHWTAKPPSIRSKVTSSFKSEFHFHKNARILLKNYEVANLIHFLPWLLFAYSIRVFKNLIEGNFVPLKAFIKSIFWNIYNLPDSLSERRRIQRIRKRTDEEMFDKLSIKGNFFNFYFNFLDPNLERVRQVFGEYRKNQKNIDCPVCGELIINKDKYIRRVNEGHIYKICAACNYGVLWPYPKKFELSNIYRQKEYFNNLSAPSKNKFIQWFLTRRIYQTDWEFIDGKFKKGSILDVGCGNGEFLVQLQKNGWEVHGIDVSSVAVKNAAAKIGQEKVKKGEFIKQTFSSKFDVISFWHVLEHLKNPVEYLNKAHQQLKDRGCVVGELPNFDSLIYRLFGPFYSWLMIPDHIGYFSKKTLMKAFKKSGFKEVKLFYPNRSLLNLALSMDKLLTSIKIPPFLRRMIFILAVPVSAVTTIFFSFFGYGEVIRFIATK